MPSRTKSTETPVLLNMEVIYGGSRLPSSKTAGKPVEAIMTNSPVAVARACMQAYVDKDRAAIEALLDKDYHFTSPMDNALDRATYMRICWPNSAAMARFDSIYEAEAGDRAFIVYEGQTTAGKRFRNSEVHTVRGGKLIATEVYFGWNVPHDVQHGEHADDEGQGHA